MGTGQEQVSPPSQSSNGPKNGVSKSSASASDEPRNTKKRSSFRREDHSLTSQHHKGVSFRSQGYNKPSSFFLSKGSLDKKWQRAHMLVGALEVKSDPFLQPKEDMKPLYKNDEGAAASKFEDALQAWEDLKLRKSFTKACVDLPDSVSCCGLSQTDNASMIKQYVTLLNDGWVKHANSKIRSRGFKIDAFLWNYNSSGKTSPNILLIRFFELSTYKFRQASEEGSLDFDGMLMGDPGNREGKIDLSSHYSASHNSSEDIPNR